MTTPVFVCVTFYKPSNNLHSILCAFNVQVPFMAAYDASVVRITPENNHAENVRFFAAVANECIGNIGLRKGIIAAGILAEGVTESELMNEPILINQ